MVRTTRAANSHSHWEWLWGALEVITINFNIPLLWSFTALHSTVIVVWFIAFVFAWPSSDYPTKCSLWHIRNESRNTVHVPYVSLDNNSSQPSNDGEEKRYNANKIIQLNTSLCRFPAWTNSLETNRNVNSRLPPASIKFYTANFTTSISFNVNRKRSAY